MEGWRSVWTVLVADSTGGGSSALVRHLQEGGHRVINSRNGREALDAINNDSIDAIVVRMRPVFEDTRPMNGLGGFMWAIALEHGIPLIVTTDRRRDVPYLQEWQAIAFAEQEESTAADIALRQAIRHCKTRRLRPTAE